MRKNKIGVVIATAMSVTIVVGAGLLALPGLSFSLAGKLGYLPWMLVAFFMIPLLYVFSYFSAHNPSAGGVVGYIRVSLGQKFASMAEMIVLGTFTLGIPAIALIGSEYLVKSVPGINIFQAGLLMIGLAYISGIVGLKISGSIQTAIAAFIVVGLLGIAVIFLFNADWRNFSFAVKIDSSQYKGIASVIPLVLFAFTGWEMTAFLAEDMEDPKKDMPKSIWISFFIVVLIYIFVAWTVANFGENNDAWKLTPFVELAKHSFGEFGGVMVGIIAALIVVANVVAAFFSASRAIYSAGRDGFLPRFVGKENSNEQPMVAMTVIWVIFSLVVFLTEKLNFGAESLLQLAGQNFFILYLLCSIGFVKIHYGKNLNFFIGLVAIISVLAMLFLFSISGIVYCAFLALVGLLFSKVSDSSEPEGKMNEATEEVY